MARCCVFWIDRKYKDGKVGKYTEYTLNLFCKDLAVYKYNIK